MRENQLNSNCNCNSNSNSDSNSLIPIPIATRERYFHVRNFKHYLLDVWWGIHYMLLLLLLFFVENAIISIISFAHSLSAIRILLISCKSKKSNYKVVRDQILSISLSFLLLFFCSQDIKCHFLLSIFISLYTFRRIS